MVTEKQSKTHVSPGLESRLAREADEALRRALDNLAERQSELGCWTGDYGGPMFLLPMYVILCRVADQEIPRERRGRMITYLRNVQNPDGSVGLHCEGAGSMFTTTLCYVALRLLGVDAQDRDAAAMRSWMLEHGTALGAAPWGKWMLCLLGLYDYRGLNPTPPELWLLPYSAPVHPGRLWCHCRQVYLPASYLYGIRAQISPDELLLALRQEIYDSPYAEIDFAAHRDTICEADSYTPQSLLMRAANRTLLAYEQLPNAGLRGRALAEVLRHIDYEDMVTNFIDIGPVNSVMNTICHHFREPGGERFQRGFEALEQYLWDGHDGLKMQGYNNSQLWDTAFAIQAIISTPYADEHARTLELAHRFVRDNQILEDVPEREAHYRDPCRGGWPFSNRAHGWPITDCTAEGFKAAVAMEQRVERPVPEELLADAIRLILYWQNDDGGWATYERTRGAAWLELLNPSGVFGDIMIDYSHTECTSACVQALALARRRFPGWRCGDIDAALERGVEFLRRRQLPDGSWEGAWGVCFTYGAFFAVSALVAAGVSADDPAVGRACSFLLARQRPDGAWAEHHSSCAEGRYVQGAEPHMVNTSWALLALLRGGCTDREALARGVKALLEGQGMDGGWPREAIVGMFNKTCAITYDNYRHYFPLWALSEWLQSVGRP